MAKVLSGLYIREMVYGNCVDYVSCFPYFRSVCCLREVKS